MDYLEKKRKWNEGEVDQYYHTGTHPQIIEPDTFDLAKVEMERRQALGRSYSGNPVDKNLPKFELSDRRLIACSR